VRACVGVAFVSVHVLLLGVSALTRFPSLRPGMCFTCQRNLNEKRRTERKRVPSSRGGRAGFDDDNNHPAGGAHHAFGLSPSIIYAFGPSAAKRFKTSNGGILELTHDAVIINAPSELLVGLVSSSFGAGDGDGDGPPPASSDDIQQHPQNLQHVDPGDAPGGGCATPGGGSSVHDVSGGGGLLRSTREALADVERLVASSGEEDDHHGALDGSASSAVAAEAAATAAAVAAAVTVTAAAGGGETEASGHHHHHLVSAEAAATAVHLLEQQDGGSDRDVAAAASSSSAAAPNVHDLYESALKSLLRSVYLLHQWKTSWDAAVETVSDPHFADAVASAAAVAAAAHAGAAAAGAENPSFHAENATFHEGPVPTASSEHPIATAPGNNDPLGSNMVSLLLAADDKQRQTGGESGEEEHPADGQLDDRGSSHESLSHAHQMMDGDDDIAHEV
jgi:hypothetical protein